MQITSKGSRVYWVTPAVGVARAGSSISSRSRSAGIQATG